MNKIKQREAMKSFAIAQLQIKQIANIVNIPPEFIESCVSMNEFALGVITSTPAKVFRANKPRVDERRLRRSHRQVKSVKSLTLKLQPSDSEQIKEDWDKFKSVWEGRRSDVVILGVDPAKAGCDISVISDSKGKVTGVSTGYRCDPELFNEQHMTHPDIDNSEESYLINLHKKAGFDLPHGGNNCSLQSLRASYNFKAKKAGIETYKWTNK